MITPVSFNIRFAGCNGDCKKPGFDPKTCANPGCSHHEMSASDTVRLSSIPAAGGGKPGLFSRIRKWIKAFVGGFVADMKLLFGFGKS